MNKLANKKGLLLVAGGIGVTALGVVMAKKASLKCVEIMEEHESTKRVIEECSVKCSEEYTEEDMNRDIIINNTQTTIKLVKVYMIPGMTILTGGIMVLNGTRSVIRMRKIDKLAETLI